MMNNFPENLTTILYVIIFKKKITLIDFIFR